MPNMSDISINNKRIAKNTAILYFRLIITTLVSLYTTRVVLRTLGASDYGVFDVMGGVIGMLGYFNTILSGSVSRFLTIDLGRGDRIQLKSTFSMCNTLSMCGIVCVFLLAETIGVWFVSNKLNIDPLRMDAAMWVYQCAVISALITLYQMPFSASIIAHEDMSIYGMMSIIDAILKLVIVFGIVNTTHDKLKIYAVLLLLVHLVNAILYWVYCKKKYPETNFSFSFDKAKFSAMFNYSGWTTIGSIAGILNNYGITILINIFFGTILNAARGVASMVSSVVDRMFSGFQTASKPQIFKYYGSGDIGSMANLVTNTSKYSGFLVLLCLIPIVAHIDGLLNIWLGDKVPDYTSAFVRCVVFQSFLRSLDYPIGAGIQAVGKMKLPNLTTSFLYLVVFPITYISFRLGANPVSGYLVFICSLPLIICVDLLILRYYTGFNISLFLKNAILPQIKVLAFGSALPVLLELVFTSHSIIAVLGKTLLSVLYVAATVFFLGLTKENRAVLIGKVRNFIRK